MRSFTAPGKSVCWPQWRSLAIDYFTSYFYASGELMSALHPYGLQKYAYIGVAFIALANFVFGALYMYALGIFNEGGGSYTASMRYLTPALSLVVAVVLIQDYTLTIVVSALSGGDQLLSILNLYGHNWVFHFMIGASLAFITWFLTIRGRGESSFVGFLMLGVFVLLTVTMAVGLFLARSRGVPAAPAELTEPVSLGRAAVPHAHGDHEGYCCLERPRGHVQWYPVCQERGLCVSALGEATPAPAARIVEVLQRQGRNRSCGADLLPVLRGDDHALPGVLLDPFQCVRWYLGQVVGWESVVHWILSDSRGDPALLGVPDPGGVSPGGSLDDRATGCAGDGMARCRHR